VPTSLCAMAIVELACLNRHADGAMLYCAETLRVAFMLFLSYLLTAFFIAQLGQMVGEQFSTGERECNMNFALLIFSCVFVFEVSMLKDFEKCLNLAKLLYFAEGQAPQKYAKVDTAPPAEGSGSGGITSHLTLLRPRSAPTEAPPKMGTGAILAQEEEGRAGSLASRFVARVRNQTSDKELDQHGIKRWSLKGTSCCYRLSCVVLVILPKCCLDLMLAYLGGLFVASTGEANDMLLNTLAVVFVAEIDEMMYAAFTSSAMRFNLENMESARMNLDNRRRVAMWLFHSLMVPVVVVLIAIAVTWYGSGCSSAGSWEDLHDTLSWESFFPRRSWEQSATESPIAAQLAFPWSR